MLRYSAILLGLWSSLVSASSETDYCSAEVDGANALISLRENLNYHFPTPYQRSYTAFRFGLYKAGERLSQGGSYEAAYNAGTEALAFAQKRPIVAKDFILRFWNRYEEKSEPVRSKIDDILLGFDPIDQRAIEICNQRLRYLVQNNPVQRPANIILLFGKLTNLVKYKKSEIEDMAKTNTEVQLWKKAKTEYKEIILLLADTYRLLK